MSDLIRQTIEAGANLPVLREAGLFLLNEAEAPVRVKLYRGGTSIFDASGMQRGVKIRPEGGFDRVEIINASVAAVYVEAFVCAGDVDVQIATGIQVTVDNEVVNPVPVDVQGAVLSVSEVTLKSSGAVTDATAAPGAIAGQFAAADADRRSLRVKNTGAVDVAIGGPGVAFATAAVVLLPGEVWVESDGAGCAWYAVTESAAGSLAVQGVA